VVSDLPASERYFAGGDTTVRGFAQDRLGRPDTFDSDGFPTGGHALVIFNAELRVPVWRDLGAVAFLDTGNVFAVVDDVSLGHLRGGAGFGIRYRSPIGPLRIDLGFKLSRERFANGDLEPRTALHISLGQAF
jgi:outer membrane translocation and assembly module TamA